MPPRSPGPPVMARRAQMPSALPVMAVARRARMPLRSAAHGCSPESTDTRRFAGHSKDPVNRSLTLRAADRAGAVECVSEVESSPPAPPPQVGRPARRAPGARTRGFSIVRTGRALCVLRGSPPEATAAVAGTVQALSREPAVVARPGGTRNPFPPGAPRVAVLHEAAHALARRKRPASLSRRLQRPMLIRRQLRRGL